MIYGIGTDIIAISRIEDAITKNNDRFLDRIFTRQEQDAADKRRDKSRFYALRWAAKEAAWKALSPGYKLGVGWHDLEIATTEDGKPRLTFHGMAAAYFKEETERQGKTALSLSDDGGMALAFVVLFR